MGKEKSVFISYSSQDSKIVKQIADMLQEENINYWKAPEMIPAGSSYAREIPRAIKQCEVFLLVVSGTSQQSIWVEKETDSAISYRKYIIPFQIDNTPLNDTFRFYLNNVQMISYMEKKENAFDELREHLSQLIKETSTNELTENFVKGATEKSEIKQNQSPKRNYVKREGTNALRINRIPLECDYCGSRLLENITMGTYRCKDCGQDSYDDYQTIRNYLEKVGTAPAPVIERHTGVPKKVIEYFFREEYLEIPKASPVRVPCEGCGAPIRTGTLCDACKNSGKKPSSDSRKGSWHSLY